MAKMKWTMADVRLVAETCDTTKQFRERFPGAWSWAWRNHKTDEVCRHMRKPVRWDFDSVKEIAEQCETKDEFRNNPIHGMGPYEWARRNKKMDELASHLVDKPRERNRRTGKFRTVKQIVKFIASNQITTRKALLAKSRPAYRACLSFRTGVTYGRKMDTGRKYVTSAGSWDARIEAAFRMAAALSGTMPEKRDTTVQGWCETPGCNGLQCQRPKPRKRDGKTTYYNICRRCRRLGAKRHGQ